MIFGRVNGIEGDVFRRLFEVARVESPGAYRGRGRVTGADSAMPGKDGVLIAIPSRMASGRLPGKPLLDLGGKSMIVRVVEAARRAGFGEPLVAAGDVEIVEEVSRAGAKAVLTEKDLASGTDRVYAALSSLGGAAADFEAVVNLQGDMPIVDPEIVGATVEVLRRYKNADVATAVIPMSGRAAASPSKVKAVCFRKSDRDKSAPVRYFSRSKVPHGGPFFLHVGIYAYRVEALRRFVTAKPGLVEMSERLEQLRGLEIGLKYRAAIMSGRAPVAIDTVSDYKRALRLFASGA